MKNEPYLTAYISALENDDMGRGRGRGGGGAGGGGRGWNALEAYVMGCNGKVFHTLRHRRAGPIAILRP